jgi:NADH-quinone oxidoreductase subunit C
MTEKEIYDKLAGQFGDTKVTGFVESEAGDHWINVAPKHIHEVALYLRDQPDLKFDGLQCLSGMDWKDRLGVVYHLYSYELGHRIVLHVDVARSENPLDASLEEVESVAAVWPTADWHEREAYDMVGVRFINHPDFRRILCPDDWEGWPLRKDYKTQEFYRGMPVPYPADEDLDAGGTWVFKDRFPSGEENR